MQQVRVKTVRKVHVGDDTTSACQRQHDEWVAKMVRCKSEKEGAIMAEIALNRFEQFVEQLLKWSMMTCWALHELIQGVGFGKGSSEHELCHVCLDRQPLELIQQTALQRERERERERERLCIFVETDHDRVKSSLSSFRNSQFTKSTFQFNSKPN
ncbi:hypothetical protein VNO78_15503 [Psophocarpus tetragonolobus]|uniref:Uncharacterized protein n=1 Tax=Psophocarpus tetragonolobus TaxID=3891 RepID=A0AAN9XJ90_PSOTE